MSDYVAARRAVAVDISVIESSVFQSLSADDPLRKSHERKIIDGFNQSLPVGQSAMDITLQISDSTLYTLVETVFRDIIGAPRTTLSDTASFEEITTAIRDKYLDPVALNRNVMRVNQRIEELMSGAELTELT